VYNRTITSGASPLFQGPHWLGSLLRSCITTHMINNVVIEENTTASANDNKKDLYRKINVYRAETPLV